MPRMGRSSMSRGGGSGRGRGRGRGSRGTGFVTEASRVIRSLSKRRGQARPSSSKTPGFSTKTLPKSSSGGYSVKTTSGKGRIPAFTTITPLPETKQKTTKRNKSRADQKVSSEYSINMRELRSGAADRTEKVESQTPQKSAAQIEMERVAKLNEKTKTELSSDAALRREQARRRRRRGSLFSFGRANRGFGA